MAYAPTILNAIGVGKITLKAGVTVSKGDLLGYSSGWTKADSDGGIAAKLVAMENGDGDDTNGGAIINACHACTIEDLDAPFTEGADQYLSNTAGAYTESVLSQRIGRALSTTVAVFQMQPGTAVVSFSSTVADDLKITLGDDADIALAHRSTVLNANTTLSGVISGTPVTPAIAANSYIIANNTTDGDILMVTRSTHSYAAMWVDASAKITRFYSGNGVEILKLDSAAYTLTGLGTLAGGFRTSGASHVGFGAAEAATVASGVLTVTKPYVDAAGEGATTDTIDSISCSGQAEGDILIVRNSHNYTLTFDNSATMLLGAGTRAVAQGGAIIFVATSATIWSELAFLTAAS